MSVLWVESEAENCYMFTFDGDEVRVDKWFTFGTFKGAWKGRVLVSPRMKRNGEPMEELAQWDQAAGCRPRGTWMTCLLSEQAVPYLENRPDVAQIRRGARQLVNP